MLLWSIEETAGFDSAWAVLDPEARTLAAEGRTSGLRPEPYWLTYAFQSDPEYVTRRMRVEARDVAGSTTLDLRRADGHWTVNGDVRSDLDGALDLDLGACPLTNTMPILRHRLHEAPGDVTFLMAFIEVPSLAVVPSTQRYTHLRRLADGSSVVRYRSGSFESDLTIDADGFVIDYPQLGHRVDGTRATPRAAGSTIGRRDR